MNENPTAIDEGIEESVEEDKSMMDKIEEATGGTHPDPPVAGDEQEGNFEGIIRGRDAESM